ALSLGFGLEALLAGTALRIVLELFQHQRQLIGVRIELQAALEDGREVLGGNGDVVQGRTPSRVPLPDFEVARKAVREILDVSHAGGLSPVEASQKARLALALGP